MNPFRALFLAISRTPPAVMLLAIIGLAVVVTVTVTGELNKNQKAFDDKERELRERIGAKGTAVYAVKDIPEGEPIPSEALAEKQLEQSKIPQDALSSASLASGRVAKYGISAGQIVSQHDLAATAISLGFQSHLKEGMRAVTFAVDSNSGVAGFVSPASRVDVLAMVGSGAETKARPILSDVEVIAVGQNYQKAPGASTAVPASSVTVAVDPGDAEKLIKAVVASKLYLTLRNDRDHTPVATADVTALFAKPPAAAGSLAALPSSMELPVPPPIAPAEQSGNRAPGSFAQAPLPPMHDIEVWSGSRKDVVSLPALNQR